MAENTNSTARFLVPDDEPVGSFRFEYIRVEQSSRPLPWGERAHWIPAVDVCGNDKVVVLEVHIPGVLPDEFRCEFGANWIRIIGSRRDISLSGRQEFYHVEIARGNFERLISLPDGLDTQKTEFTSELGVLRIEIPWKTREWAISCRNVRFPEEWS